jgi:hypothetical protein
LRGDLTGVVREVGGEPLFEVQVTATNVETGAILLLETDRGGTFGASLLHSGQYDLLAETPGFIPKLVRGAQVRAGQSTFLSIELEPAPPPVTSIDTVFAGRITDRKSNRRIRIGNPTALFAGEGKIGRGLGNRPGRIRERGSLRPMAGGAG